jgi:hypothetical protein
VIRPPHRSVTRFFIPLMDVMILLFCIFLLMPYVTPTEADATPDTNPLTRDTEVLRSATADDVPQLRQDLQRAESDRDRLRERLDTLLKRLSVRVMEIDRDSGMLHFYDPDRVDIVSEADAQRLIARDQRAAAGREVYFLFVFPREVSGYPLQKQVDAYRRWFRDVPYGFDNPRGRR